MNSASNRVLLADPQPDSRRIIRQALETAGFTVETAANGQDVLLACEVDPPDILILELRQPDCDGFELVQLVRYETRDRDLTVILMTEPSDDMTRAYLGPMVDFAGGDYYFSRPCDGSLVVALIEKLNSGRTTVPNEPLVTSPTHAVWPTSRSHRSKYANNNRALNRPEPSHPNPPAPRPWVPRPSPARPPATPPRRPLPQVSMAGPP